MSPYFLVFGALGALHSERVICFRLSWDSCELFALGCWLYHHVMFESVCVHNDGFFDSIFFLLVQISS